jgi:viologen exporter family transport system permease protein
MAAPMPSSWRPYQAILTARLRTLLQYRGAAVAGAGTQVFFGLIRLMVLEAFYRSSTASPSFSFAEAVGYVWLGQVTFTMQPYNLDRDVRAMVRTGTVAYELLRPVDLYALWYSRNLAWRTGPMLLRVLPMLVLSAVALPLLGLHEWALAPPPSLASGALWLLSLAGALAFSCAITTLMSISLLWTISGEGIAILIGSLVTLLSGMVIPLPLFPAWAQPALRLLPFAALVDLPARVYTGHIPPAQAGWVLLHQTLWTAALVLVGRALLARGPRRLVLQGG